MMKINGLVQKKDEASATAYYTPGALYEDENGEIYQYAKASTYVSAYFVVAINAQTAGTTCTVNKNLTVSTKCGDAIAIVNVAAGYYAFFKKAGVAEAYVTSSVAANATLMSHASTAGALAAKTSTIADGVAKTLETGLGMGTATSCKVFFPL